jgi:hypothetical protein
MRWGLDWHGRGLTGSYHGRMDLGLGRMSSCGNLFGRTDLCLARTSGCGCLSVWWMACQAAASGVSLCVLTVGAAGALLEARSCVKRTSMAGVCTD